MSQDPELLFLQRLSRAAAETLDASAMVELVITETTDAVGVDVCSVYLLDPDGTSLRLAATNGLSQAGVGHVVLPVGDGITGWAASTRRPVVVPDVREDRRFRWMVGVDQARFVSMCSVPILAADRLIGVINVQTDQTRHFTMSDVDFLMSIAAQVAGVFERSALQAQLERRIASLHRAEDIHLRFTELALEAAGLERVCEEITTHSGRDVAVYDHDGQRLTPADQDRFPDVLPADASDPPFALMPLGAGGLRLGWLAARAGSIRDDEAPDDGATAMEHGATVLALEMSRRRAAAETEERLRGDFIDELLTPSLGRDDAERILERGARLGYRLRRNMWVAVLIPDDDGGRALLRDGERGSGVHRAVAAVVEARHPGSIVVRQADAVVCLIAEPAAPDHVESVAALALDAISTLGGGDFSAGVSGRAGAPAELARRAEEARLAHRIGRRLGRERAVSAHRRLGAERLLLAVEPQSALPEFVEEWLGPLIRIAPGTDRPTLLDTLTALVETGWNLRETARRCDETVHAVQGRVQRMRETIRRDLDSPDVRLSLALALRARPLAGEGIDLREDAILPAVEVAP